MKQNISKKFMVMALDSIDILDEKSQTKENI